MHLGPSRVVPGSTSQLCTDDAQPYDDDTSHIDNNHAARHHDHSDFLTKFNVQFAFIEKVLFSAQLWYESG